MAETRQMGMAGVARLTRAEISQWEADELLRLDHWERKTLLGIDALFVSMMNGGDLPENDEDETEADEAE